MKKINYEDWKRRKPEVFRKLLEVENTFEGRVPGRRPRDPEKERILLRLDLARRARYIGSGKLQIIDSRHWRWRIDYPHTEA